MTAEEGIREIYEIYAGMEGIPTPETACEGYLLHIINQMKNIASEMLKNG